MADQPSKGMSNQDKLDFLIDAILVGGASMDGTNSLQFQIKQAPVDALWNAQIDWGKYKTSALQQLAYNAQALSRIEANLLALRAVITEINGGEPVDYDRFDQIIKDNMQEFTVPEFEIIVKPKEG